MYPIPPSDVLKLLHYVAVPRHSTEMISCLTHTDGFVSHAVLMTMITVVFYDHYFENQVFFVVYQIVMLYLRSSWLVWVAQSFIEIYNGKETLLLLFIISRCCIFRCVCFQEMQQSMNMLNPNKQNMPDLSEMAASFFGGGKKPTPKSKAVKSGLKKH